MTRAIKSSSKQDSLKIVLGALKERYGNADCALNHRNPFELLVATILSAQCTDERVNRVTPELFARFPTAAKLAKAKIEDIEDLVRTTGFFRNKARNLKECARVIHESHQGVVPKSLDELTALPGVGRKTANVVLGVAFHVAVGVVVDTHVKRLSYRLGWTKNKTPEKIEQDLMKLLPRADWILTSHLLILHGRQLCKALKPKCSACFLFDRCPKSGVK